MKKTCMGGGYFFPGGGYETDWRMVWKGDGSPVTFPFPFLVSVSFLSGDVFLPSLDVDAPCRFRHQPPASEVVDGAAGDGWHGVVMDAGFLVAHHIDGLRCLSELAQREQ